MSSRNRGQGPWRGRGRRGGNNARVVTNKIRNLHLNSAPHWYEPSAGKRTRGIDVPQYVSDTVYSRRVRFVVVSAEPPVSITVTVANIYTALGWTIGNTSFSQIFVRRISAYGPDTGTLVLSPYIANNQTTTTIDRQFSDIGVPGSRRCNVVVEISPKDSSILTSGTPTVCTLLPGVGTSMYIVDFHCEFSGTNTTALGASCITDKDDPLDVERISKEELIPINLPTAPAAPTAGDQEIFQG